MIVVPHSQLSEDALDGLIADFVTRGNDVANLDQPLAPRVAAVRRWLADGRASIVYDEESESCTIMTKEELQRIEALPNQPQTQYREE